MHLLRRTLSTKRIAIITFVSTIVVLNYLSDSALSDIFSQPVAIVKEPPGTWDGHPVVLLHRDAENQFNAFLKRQSTDPSEAEQEYRRRYGRQPPLGFRRWVEYALANGSPVIDDFDMIAESVHPFLKYSAAEIEHRVQSAVNYKIGNHNEICEFAEGRFGPGCRTWADPLTRLLGDARRLVPDVKLLFNFLDEPSVLLKTQETIKGGDSTNWTDLSHRSIIGAIDEACKAHGKELSSTLRGPANPLGINFLTSTTTAKDLCQHPEYASQHGFVMSPKTFRRLPSEVPMLSRAAPRPFSDILYPATHYSIESSLYSPWSDWLWGMKKNAVYWTGSSTGGEWSHDTWRKGHRQRLVALATSKEHRSFTFLRSSPGDSSTGGGVQPYTSDAFDTSLFDVGLTRTVGCATTAICDEQERFFGEPRRGEAESRPLRYRFALDVDGNSFSGRFYRFLASRSVPLKVSIFREWHDERLKPWLHYVPVSVDMGELPELVRFMTSTAEGQRIARRIADAGRGWYSQAMTPTQQGIYLYRLMLEMARLQDDTREAG
ncbi:hypothetical protein EsH8_IX_000365 [Colletotrichum jinshuiense]